MYLYTVHIHIYCFVFFVPVSETEGETGLLGLLRSTASSVLEQAGVLRDFLVAYLKFVQESEVRSLCAVVLDFGLVFQLWSSCCTLAKLNFDCTALLS